MIYRSKDSTLPDFSKEDGPGGEIFFDVCHSFVLGINGNDSVYYLTLAKLARRRWHCCLVCNRVLQVWRVLCLWYLPLCKHSFQYGSLNLLTHSLLVLTWWMTGEWFLHGLRSSHVCTLGSRRGADSVTRHRSPKGRSAICEVLKYLLDTWFQRVLLSGIPLHFLRVSAPYEHLHFFFLVEVCWQGVPWLRRRGQSRYGDPKWQRCHALLSSYWNATV